MRGRGRRAGLLITLAACIAAALPSAGNAALPVHYSATVATANAIANPDTPPPGSNDISCRPTAAHPRPVVLVHGTLANMTINWNALSPLLANNGYCVFALNYGQQSGRLGFPGSSEAGGTGPVEGSAAELAAFVSSVRAATGARKVDIVGHSQGGMMPRYFLRFLGGAAEVRTLVGLASSNHGTTLNGLNTLISLIPEGPGGFAGFCGDACSQQMAGSEFMTNLNRGGDTVPGVRYTVIQTRYDRVVTPYTSAFLSGRHVTNILLQKQCPLDFSDHLSLAYDHIALREVLNALDPQHAKRAACTPVAPVEGG